ncbi:MAG: Ig-like domain-containing protein, partial [Gemmatimonadota bacterium]
MKFHPYPRGPLALLLVPVFAGILTVSVAHPLPAQQESASQVATIVMEPDSLVIAVGEQAVIQVTALDTEGNPVPDPDMMVWMQGAEASVDQTTGIVTGVLPGETVIETRIRTWAPGRIGYEDLKAYTHVVVRDPPIERIEIDAGAGEIFRGTRETLVARALSSGGVREGPTFRWSSSDPAILEIGPAGLMYGRGIGTARVTATAEGVSGATEIRVVENPIRELRVEPVSASVRVGDVLRLTAGTLDESVHPVSGGTVHWSWEALENQPFDAIQLDTDDSRTAVIVPNETGLYRITAQIGGLWRDVLLRALPR